MQLVNNQDTEVYIACKIKIQNVKLCQVDAYVIE